MKAIYFILAYLTICGLFSGVVANATYADCGTPVKVSRDMVIDSLYLPWAIGFVISAKDEAVKDYICKE